MKTPPLLLPFLLLACARHPTPPPPAPDVAAGFDSTYPVEDDGRHGTIRLHDFNRDGRLDTLEEFYSGGSGFGGRFITLTVSVR